LLSWCIIVWSFLILVLLLAIFEPFLLSLVMDSQTHQRGYYTNITDEDGLFIVSTNKILNTKNLHLKLRLNLLLKNHNGIATSPWPTTICLWRHGFMLPCIDIVQGNQQKYKVYWKIVCDYFQKHKTFEAKGGVSFYNLGGQIEKKKKKWEGGN
jgi:hypothetical protein